MACEPEIADRCHALPYGHACCREQWPTASTMGVRSDATQQPFGSRRVGAPAVSAGPRLGQISVCSEISRASSTSIPRYLTVDSSLECPSNSCTARRFLVRR